MSMWVPVILFIVVGILLTGGILVIKDNNRQRVHVPNNQLVVRCPKCHSTNYTANKNGFGVGKAAVGALVAGPIGLAAGAIGSSNVMLTCLSCGNRWSPNSFSANIDKEYQRREIERSTPFPKQPRVLKESVHKQMIENAIKNHKEPHVISAIIRGIQDNLKEENITVVSDEEFTGLTGKQ